MCCAVLCCVRHAALFVQIVDYNFLATVIAAFGRYMPDYKRAMADGVPGAAAAPASKKAH